MKSSFNIFSVGFGKWRTQLLVNGNVFSHKLHKSQEDAEQEIERLEEMRAKARRAVRDLKNDE